MARLNLKIWRSWFAHARTHEGGPAKTITHELQLRRSALACLLWEDQFYEDGIEIAGRIAVQVPPRQGFALCDAILASQPHNGTYLGRAPNFPPLCAERRLRFD